MWVTRIDRVRDFVIGKVERAPLRRSPCVSSALRGAGLSALVNCHR